MVVYWALMKGLLAGRLSSLDQLDEKEERAKGEIEMLGNRARQLSIDLEREETFEGGFPPHEARQWNQDSSGQAPRVEKES